MLSAEFIDKVYGVGSYILINCKSEFTNYFLSMSYRVAHIESLTSAPVLLDDFYDYMIIHCDDAIDETIISEDILKLIIKQKNLKNLLIISECRQDETHEIERLCNLLNISGFGYDQILSAHLNEKIDEFRYFPLVKVDKHSDIAGLISIEKGLEELTKYVRPNENVCIIHEESRFLADLISRFSSVKGVKAFKDCQSFFKSTKILDEIYNRDGQKKKFYYDCILLLDQKNKIYSLDSLKIFAENLSPGGRIIFKADSFDGFKEDDFFEIEVVYSREAVNTNNCGCEIITSGLDGYYVVMKSPLIDYERFKYIEKSYSYSYPPKHLLMFERDYINPWLVKAMVEFPTRNRNKLALKRYANRIVKLFDNKSPDYAAAAAIIGYQAMTEKSDESFALENINAFIRAVNIIKKKSAHQVRWLISLSVLAAELLKLQNKTSEALGFYQQALCYDFHNFSPTIGTKLLQAYYNVALILYTSGDASASFRYLSEALEKGIEILNVSYKELLGNKEKPLVFTLFIYHDILDWIIKIANLKNHLGKNDHLIPMLNSQTWSALLKDRMDAIQNMSAMISERDEAINAQGKMLEERMDALNELELIISSQKEIIDERWNAMQEMEQMIIERDNTISELKKMI
ncbi:hypothetical protein OJ965_09105 [Pantoea anthophila]|uniref:hypothetical protein n=1 Tax=Pantoea anthophila TaxID=470931 RepID=UPI0022360CB4|nr:hypothetical protein [Pantoea anthophila]UZH04253.1 hypothetical protein OJ965_09105 [Pantoea anthophila]